jgi:hypothetical protein
MKHADQEIAALARGFQTETAGEVLPDGTILELIRENTNTGKLSLQTWDGATAKVAGYVKHNGRTYVPAALDPTILRAMRLPSRIVPYASTRALFDDLCGLVIQFSGLPEEFVLMIAYFVLGAWLVDRVPVAPLLSIVAPPTSPTMVLLQLLALVCRRALWLGDVSPTALCALPMCLRPTLLLDEVNLDVSCRRLLRASNTRGVYVARNGRALDLYSPKVVCSREPLRDALLASRALQVALAPPRRQLPVLDGEASEQIADEFQAKLLMYRLSNYSRVGTPHFDLGGLSGPTQDLARTLGACIIDDDELQAGIVPLLKGQDEQIRLERTVGLEYIVVEALLFCAHDGDRTEVRVAELAEIANTILAGRHESLRLAPESVGWRLRALGLHTQRIGSAGKGLRLLGAVRARIHELARAYELPWLQQGANNQCPYCAQVVTNDAEP